MHICNMYAINISLAVYCFIQIQELGLASVYRHREDIQHICGMLDGLAFLPVVNIAEGLAYIRTELPTDVPELTTLIQYFESTYISGSVRSSQPRDSRRLLLRVRRAPPPFPPATWNVHQATIDGTERTNNVCEGWNNAFANLVGHRHPSLWVLLGALQQDQAVVATDLIQDAMGQPPTKRVKRNVRLHQERLQQLCSDLRDGRRTVTATLRAVGHCVRLL